MKRLNWNLWKFLRNLFRKKRKIFLVADLHLDHKNIIKYCHRPFRSVQSMNRRLISNWNRTIGKNDTVYFLGDLAFGRGSRGTDYWYRKLNGRIIFIRGNHDRSKNIKFHHHKYVKFGGISFLLVHNPFEVPNSWKGWVIHGHKHNNHPRYPFINKKSKRINISCEYTKYKPVTFQFIIDNIKRVS